MIRFTVFYLFIYDVILVVIGQWNSSGTEEVGHRPTILKDGLYIYPHQLVTVSLHTFSVQYIALLTFQQALTPDRNAWLHNWNVIELDQSLLGDVIKTQNRLANGLGKTYPKCLSITVTYSKTISDAAVKANKPLNIVSKLA